MQKNQDHLVQNPEANIRRAQPGDAEILCEIRDSARIAAYTNDELGFSTEQIKLNCRGIDDEFVPRRIVYLKKMLTETKETDLTTFVAEVNGNVVGYVEPVTEEDGRHYIGGLYVSPEAQSAGIGAKLLTLAIDTLGRDKNIYLHVVSYNDRAIRFYERFGFVKTDTVIPEDTEKPDYVVTLPETEMVLKAKN